MTIKVEIPISGNPKIYIDSENFEVKNEDEAKEFFNIFLNLQKRDIRRVVKINKEKGGK